MSAKNYLASNPESRMIYEAIVSGGPMTSAEIGRIFPEMDCYMRKSIMQRLRVQGYIECQKEVIRSSTVRRWRALR